MQPDLNVVKQVLDSASDQRDYEIMHASIIIAQLTDETVPQHNRRVIESTLFDVKNEDGSPCPPEDRAGWKHLVY